MRLAHHPLPASQQSLQWVLVYALLLPLFAIYESVSQLFAKIGAGEEDHPAARGSWGAEARSQASTATSCAMMALSMLQSSERPKNSERPSRR